MRPRSCDADAGFTLIELLVAITVLAFVMLLLFGGLRFGARVWERSEGHLSGTSEIGRVQGLLRQALAGAYPAFIPGTRGSAHVDFDGAQDQVTFLAPAPQALAAAGWVRVTLTMQETEGVPALTMSVCPELAAHADGHSEALLSRIRGLTVSYFGSRDLRTPPAWHDSWQGAVRLPQLIRIAVEFPDGDKRIWPEFVVAPAITADVSCTYDALTRDCQGR